MARFVGAMLMLAVLAVVGCSSANSSYYYAQMLANRDNLDFQDSLKADEYLNAFDQDWLAVPEGEDVVLRVDALADTVPAVGENALYQVAVKTRRPTAEELRQPMALSLVMDVSGSMTGEKMSDLKTALKNAILELRDGDKVSLVTFNSEANVLASALMISAEVRAQLVASVDSIVAGGGTNIEAGLIAGYQEMSKLTDVPTRRLLLLTDGVSSVAAVSPELIAQRANVGFIEGARISTIGLGADVDQEVLRYIAAQGNGHYYFANNSKTLTSILREGLATTVIPVASGIQLTLQLGAGYELVRLYGGQHDDDREASEAVTANTETASSSTSKQVSLGELNAHDWRVLIAEVRRISLGDSYAKSSHAETPKDVVLNVSGEYQPVAGGNVIALHPSAESALASEAESINRNVLRNATLYANAQALIEVGTLAREERYDDALRVIDLQINNNRILETYDTSEMVANERETLETVRQTVVLRKDFSEGKKAPVTGYIDAEAESKAQRRAPLPPSNLRNLVLGGLDLVSGTPSGTWATLANILGAALTR
jgi:Ca-activated chloride channel family protein